MSQREEFAFNVNNKHRHSKREFVKHSLHNMLSALEVGQKIPAERNLAKVLSTSRQSIRTILNELESNGIIKTEQGSGTFLVRPLAKDIKTSTDTANIGVVLPSSDNPVIRDVAMGISAASKESGFVTIMRDIGWDVNAELKCLYELSKMPLHGLIIYPFHTIVFERKFIDFIQKQIKRGLPVVLLERYLPLIDTCYVIPDYFQAAYISTRHLIMLAHRKILNLSVPNTMGSSGIASLRGYKQALQDYGIPYRDELVVEREDYVDHPREGAYRILKEFLSKNSHLHLPFTAIYCAHKSYVYGAYRALKEHGLKVPEDIAIVSKDECNDPPYNTAVDWTFTDFFWEEIGRKAVDLIKLQHSGLSPQDERHQHIILPPNLVIRKSCGMYLGQSRTKQKSDGPAQIKAVSDRASKKLASELIAETGT